MWRTGVAQWNGVLVIWPSWHAIPWLNAFLLYHLGALVNRHLQTTLVLRLLAMAQVSPHESGGMYSGIAVMGGTRPNGRILQAHNLYIGVV